MSDPSPPDRPGPRNPTENPYAPPRADIGSTGPEPGSPSAEAEAIRREHLSHEATIKSLGCLYYWGGVLTAVVAVLVLGTSAFLAFVQPGGGGEQMLGAGMILGLAVLYGFLAWLNIWIGRGLRNLDPKVRTLLTILLVLGGVFVAAAWALNPQDIVTPTVSLAFTAFFLWALHGAKGRMVLSDEYRRVVAQTPHLKYRTPVLFWLIVIVAVLAVIVWAVVVAS